MAGSAVLKNYLNGLISSAQQMADATGPYAGWSSSEAKLRIDIFINTLTTMQAQYGKTFNFTPYIDRLKDIVPPDSVPLSSTYYESFSDSSALLKLTSISELAAGDVLGVHSRGIDKIELLDSNKKVLATAIVSKDFERVGITLPAKFDSSKNLYLKIYGAANDDYGLVAYETLDTASVTVGAGATQSAHIDFSSDKDSYLLSDSAGFKPLTQNGAGEWHVEISGTGVSDLVPAFGKLAGVKASAFKLADGVLAADIARASAGVVAKPLELNIATKRGVVVGSDEIGYTIKFMNDDYARDKTTTASLDLGTASTDSINGEFAWKGDIDWIRIHVDKINASAGDSYAISGLASTAQLKLYDASGKKGVSVTDGEITFTKTGYYFLEVSDSAASAGMDYSLDISLVGVSPS